MLQVGRIDSARARDTRRREQGGSRAAWPATHADLLVMQVERLSEMIRNSEATNRVRRQVDALTLSVRGCIRKAIFDCPRQERN